MLSPALNAFVTVTGERALADARRADARDRARRGRSAHRRAARAQGHLLHERHPDDLRLAHARELRLALRRDRRRAARCRRHGAARQDEHGRVRDGLVERERASTGRCATLGRDTRAGRIVGRLRGRGRGAHRAGRDRHRHRRLDPPARRAHGPDGIQADVRPRVALRHDRVRVEPRPGGRAHAVRGGRGAAARRDGGLSIRAIRRASMRPCPTTSARPRTAAQKACESASSASSSATGSRPAPCGSSCAPRSTRCASRARQSSKLSPAEPAAVGADVLRRRAGGSARRTCRASTACASAIAARPPRDLLGPLQALARRGLWRRGQAPHHDRHLRAVGRLLRRVLPARRRRCGRLINGRFQPRIRAKSTSSIGPTSPTPAFELGAKTRRPDHRCT